jgi:ATP-dependent protease ClpP protease subunit
MPMQIGLALSWIRTRAAMQGGKNRSWRMAKVLLYGAVGAWYDELDAKSVVKKLSALADDEDLEVRVNSAGGSVFDGMAIYNTLRNRKGTVRVHIDGLAASIASVIAMAGDEIVMEPGSMMMVHNPWNITMGDADDHRESAELLDKVRDSIAVAYEQKTGIPRQELIGLMDDETWMTADEAVDRGFATKVGEQQVQAMALTRHDLSAFINVPGAIRAMARGEAKMSEQAPEVTPVAVAETVVPGVDVDAVRAEAVKVERERSSGIRSAVEKAGLSASFADELVNGGWTREEANAMIIDQWNKQGVAVQSAARVEVDATDKFVEGATQALMAKAGLAPRDGQNEFNNRSLYDLAEMTLAQAGAGTRGMDKMSLVQAAFSPRAAITHTSSDFTRILANVANKAMLKGYEEAGETFQQWTAAGSLPDFKPQSRVDLNLFPSLAKVEEGAEYTYGTIGDRGESIQLATFGRLFSVTRQAIINDDMSAMVRVPQRMGRAAIRTIGNLVYAVLTQNPLMADGENLFSAAHNNDGGDILSIDGLDAGRVAMALQQDPDGIASGGLNIRPSFLLVPVALEGEARILLNSQYVPGETFVPNKVAGMAQIISDARLDAHSSSEWYLAASPSLYDTIEVAYLNGVQSPVLEQREGWGVDGVEFKVRLDAGVKALDFRGLYRSND